MKNIQVVERAFALLEAVASEGGGELMLNRLAERTGLKSSTASRILCTLESMGYLEQPVAKRGYKLGRRLLELSRDPACPPELLEAARKLLPKFVERTGEYICLSTLRGATRSIVLRCNSTQAVQVKESSALIEENPYSSASGRLLLSLLDDGRREFCLRQLPPPGKLWPEMRSAKDIEKALDKLRCESMACFSIGDLSTIAAPLRYEGEAFALGVYVPSYRFQGERKEEILKMLAELPAKIEAAASKAQRIGKAQTEGQR